jgi:hypothetical protein
MLIQVKPMAFARTQKHLALIFVLLLAAGCGGRNKKNSDTTQPGQQGAAGGASVSGRVDLFSGFGMDLDRSGLADKLNKGTLVKLYRFSGQGAELIPVDGITPRPINADGSFSLDNTPSGQINLVLAVESPAGEPLLSALIPFLPSSGIRDFVVSPETNLEVDVFKQILLNKGKGGAALAALTHQNLDAALVKRIVTPDAVFDPAVQQNPGLAAQALGAAAAGALTTYMETLAGPGRPASDPSVDNVTSALREPETQIQLEQEQQFINPDAPAASTRDATDRLLSAVSNAAKQADVRTDGLSETATIIMARDRVVLQTARCLAGNGGSGCASPATGTASLDNYGRLLELQANQDAAARDISLRLNGLSGATATFDISITTALDNLQKLLALPEPQVAPLRTLAAQTTAALAQPGADPLHVRTQALLDFTIIRDYTATGFLGMDDSTVQAVASDLARRAGALAQVSANPDSPLKDIASQRKAFFAQADQALTPLLTHISATYNKLPELDQKKILQSLKSLFLCAALADVPAILFEGPDTDKDGVSDETEITIGADPNKAENLPAPVVAASPETLLPDAPADADSDGILDIVELMQGADPDDPADTPAMATLTFCSQSAQGFPCPASNRDGAPASLALSGQIVFDQSPVSGAVVGLYTTPVFLGRKPAYTADEPTNATGSFSVQAPAARYFVAAFIDTNANNAPDKGEAAGVFGALYPERITLDKNIVLASSVDMIGMIGGPPCQGGAWLSPATGACEDTCPASTTPDALTGSCRCQGRGLYALTTKECVVSCPGITVPDAGGSRCECPPHSLLDEVQSVCHCAMGMEFNADAAACTCTQGYFNPQTEACAESCPSGMPANQADRTCACPQGTQFDQTSGACMCPGGQLLNSLSGRCINQCPKGTVMDSSGRICVCPPNQKPGRGNKCECEQGFVLNEENGACEPPAPDSAAKPSAPKAAKHKPATKGDDAKRQPAETSGDAFEITPDQDTAQESDPAIEPPAADSEDMQPADATEEAGHTLTDPDADPPPGFIPPATDAPSSDSNKNKDTQNTQ